ncbi:hypothetical protein M405DRAFT_77615 [Rhizopogon salebrosus TDB-379]|nr:hypothetical protein M405DRAFT_77615 [Rhizopogon salebrosus TDB-379]
MVDLARSPYARPRSASRPRRFYMLSADGAKKRASEQTSCTWCQIHLATSSLFLPATLSYLSQGSQFISLRAYFALVLAWWISRGRPRPDIQRFLSANSHHSLDGKVLIEANPSLDIV